MVWLNALFFHKVSIHFTALRQSGTHCRVSIITCTAHSIKFSLCESRCHHSSGLQIRRNLRVLGRGCWVDGVNTVQQNFVMASRVFKLVCGLALSCWSKISSCEAELVWNASRVLSAACCRRRMSPLSASHPQESLLHSPKWDRSWPCPLTGNFFFGGDWGWSITRIAFMSPVQNDGSRFYLL
jgi:hypothetical protein